MTKVQFSKYNKRLTRIIDDKIEQLEQYHLLIELFISGHTKPWIKLNHCNRL